MNVDWSNRWPLGSNGGTVDAVDDSTMRAARETVAIPATAATAVCTRGVDCAESDAALLAVEEADVEVEEVAVEVLLDALGLEAEVERDE